MKRKDEEDGGGTMGLQAILRGTGKDESFRVGIDDEDVDVDEEEDRRVRMDEFIDA